ncbi:hypothetical protein BABINDRAFT_60533 [Babjeviella inositovora NRRL Y-12698]|uniref:Uncharacterized protein n=1 Tax=Babjeviella inositovora NRRL Y-12698 TaxID=984486 RepID=A0A1E3QSY1_9ASCO|nr:uncharacterized protein BABINDRAFT_60533 [Babjeviella inositovora NRRL Y-12698]ODQ80614.1 hypothetical protein BABINDRAFT_60533 [Babjeviella inositovora NRRL Y-12698]
MSINPQEQTYIEYLNYDWDSCADFQEGIAEIMEQYQDQLQENAMPGEVKQILALERDQLINQAKVFFFCSQTGNILSLEDYEEWKLHNGSKHSHAKIMEIEEAEAPKVNATSSQIPPYSSNYQELVGMITQGKEIPGIMQIPDTVLAHQATESSAAQRKKPWET